MLLIDSAEPDTTVEAAKSLNQECLVMQLPAGDIIIPPKPYRGNLDARITKSITGLTLGEIARQTDTTISAMTGHYGDALTKLLKKDDALLASLMKESMVIERKAPFDLLSSIGSGRLTDQARRCVMMGKFPVLLIDGEVSNDGDLIIANRQRSGWGVASVSMYLFALQSGGMMVVGGLGALLADSIRLLQNWMDKDDHLLPGKREPLPFLDPSVELEVLTCFPGIGPETAKNVTKYCGRLADCLMFLSDPESIRLKGRPKGVGPQIVRQVRKGLGLEDGEIMMPIHKEE